MRTMKSLGIPLAAATLALACERVEPVNDPRAQTYSEAAGELAADVAADVSAAAEDETRKAAE